MDRTPFRLFRRFARHECVRHDFARHESGVATLEFAIIVPVLLTLLYGVAEYVNAADNRNKVANLARTLADLTSQNQEAKIPVKMMELIIGSANPILAPFPATKASIQISAIGIYKGNKAYVCSTWPATSTKRKVGKDATLVIPTNFQREGARYVLAEVTMPYQPLFSTVLGRLMKTVNYTFQWSEKVEWPVRGGSSWALGRDAEVVIPSGSTWTECPDPTKVS